MEVAIIEAINVDIIIKMANLYMAIVVINITQPKIITSIAIGNFPLVLFKNLSKLVGNGFAQPNICRIVYHKHY